MKVFLKFAAVVTACGALGFSLVGCAVAPDGGAPGEASSALTVTESDVAALPAGQKLEIDLTSPDVGAEFDQTEQAIDFTRVVLDLPDGPVTMSAWMDSFATGGGRDLRSAPRFWMSATGVHLVSDAAGAPKVVPEAIECCHWVRDANGHWNCLEICRTV